MLYTKSVPFLSEFELKWVAVSVISDTFPDPICARFDPDSNFIPVVFDPGIDDHSDLVLSRFDFVPKSNCSDLYVISGLWV